MDEAYRWATLIVTLITLGLIPYAIAKNSKQHQDGQALRAELVKDIKEVKQDIRVVKTDVLDMKADDVSVKQNILQLREERMFDREYYIGLLKQTKEDILHEISSFKGVGNQPTEDVPGSLFGSDHSSDSS